MQPLNDENPRMSETPPPVGRTPPGLPFAHPSGLPVAFVLAGGYIGLTWPREYGGGGRSPEYQVAVAEQLGSGIIQDTMAELARTYGIWLFGGTLPLVSEEPGKVLNTMLVFNPAGEQVARYDKMHLFRYDNGRERYDEGQVLDAGGHPVAFQAGSLRVGLSICYDLRFPELYRQQVEGLGELHLGKVGAQSHRLLHRPGDARGDDPRRDLGFARARASQHVVPRRHAGHDRGPGRRLAAGDLPTGRGELPRRAAPPAPASAPPSAPGGRRSRAAGSQSPACERCLCGIADIAPPAGDHDDKLLPGSARLPA